MIRFVLALCCFLPLGCGSKELMVEGTLTKAGQPMKFEAGDEVSMTLVDLSEADEIKRKDYSANVDPATGNFNVVGRFGRGIPPGKYKVVLNAGSPKRPTDRFGGAYSLKNSPLVVEINSSNYKNLTVDLK